MKQLILHIGMPKTGSTALQHFFLNNRSILEKQGVGFFLPLMLLFEREHKANASFFREIIVGDRKGKEWFEKNKRLFREYASEFDTILLSEELLWYDSFHADGYWAEVRDLVYELYGSEAVIRPVIYLRRQDLWVLSWWKESLRIVDPVSSTFREFVSESERLGMLDFEGWLGKIENVFGKENMIVRVYDEESFGRESICHDFLRAIGVDVEEKALRESFVFSNERYNTSISLDAAYALVQINKNELPWGFDIRAYRRIWIDRLNDFSSAHPDARDVYPMETDDRIALMDRYDDGNRRVSERYIKGDGLRTEVKTYVPYRSDIHRDRNNAEAMIRLSGLPLETGRELLRSKPAKDTDDSKDHGSEKPLISVITTISRTYKHLQACIDSVTSQSFENWEMLLIDDSSTDSSRQICDEFSAADPRIHVFHQKNDGISAAKNKGLEKAAGRYIVFLDSEDVLLTRDYLNILIDAMEENDAQLAICGVISMREDAPAPDAVGTGRTMHVLSGIDTCRWEGMPKGYYFGMSGARMYTRDLFKGNSYPHGRTSEDEALAHKLIFPCEKTAVVDMKMYGWRSHSDDFNSGTDPDKLRKDTVLALTERIDYYERMNASDLVNKTEQRLLQYLRKNIEKETK